MGKVFNFAIDKIVTIVKDSLYSVKFKQYEIDEFTRAFELWADIMFLEDFFENNKNDLAFFGLTVEQAVSETLDDAEKFEQILLAAAKRGKDDLSQALQTIFKPLYKKEEDLYPPPDLQMSKAYGVRRPSWLRLYAIRVEPNVFVITGSAIKLVAEMHQREYLEQELYKLEIVRQYLLNQQIIDNDSLIGIINF